MKKRVLISLATLFIPALHLVSDPQTSTTADQTTTAISDRPARGSNEDGGSTKANKKKGSSSKKDNVKGKGAKEAPAQTSATPTDTGRQTESTSVASTSGNDTETTTSTASKSGTETSGIDTTTTNPQPAQPQSNRLLVAALILMAVTLAAVTASFIEFRKRFVGVSSRLDKLDHKLESGLGPVVRDLAPLVTTPARVLKLQELTEGISKDVTVVRNDVAELKKRPKGTEGGGEREKTPSRPPQTVASYEPEPAVERDDDSIHEMLRQLSNDCVQSPVTQVQARARVGGGWTVDSFGTGELPDAFIVDTGRGDAWFVPNTRRWSALREEGLFEVTGPDLPTARVIRVDSLPRIRRGGGALLLASGKRGRLEISIA